MGTILGIIIGGILGFASGFIATPLAGVIIQLGVQIGITVFFSIIGGRIGQEIGNTLISDPQVNPELHIPGLNEKTVNHPGRWWFKRSIRTILTEPLTAAFLLVEAAVETLTAVGSFFVGWGARKR